MTFDDDPDHPIIERPYEYDILLFCYHIDPENDRNSYLDLTLRRGPTVRRLRFLAPQDLEIEKGFPQPTRGMRILNVRRRQLDGLGVMVEDFEASSGRVTFWAREVRDLDLERLA